MVLIVGADKLSREKLVVFEQPGATARFVRSWLQAVVPDR